VEMVPGAAKLLETRI